MSHKMNYDTLAIELGQVALERDTYRELCAQLLEDLRHIKLNVSSPLDAYYIATEAVKKAEAILGERQ